MNEYNSRRLSVSRKYLLRLLLAFKRLKSAKTRREEKAENERESCWKDLRVAQNVSIDVDTIFEKYQQKRSLLGKVVG